MSHGPVTNKRRHGIFAVTFVLAALGITAFHYQDMVRPIPDFNTLQRITSDGMKITAEQLLRGGAYSFRFTDASGKRFTTKYLAAEQAKTLQDALAQGPVTLFVGRWKTALESDALLTIYHVTRGDRVLLDYQEMAAAKKKEQRSALSVITFSCALLIGILALVRKVSAGKT